MIPQRTDEQRAQALEKGNAKRLAHSKLRAQAKNGSLSFSEVLVSRADEVGPVMLAQVVAWGWPKMGASRRTLVGKVAAREGINLMHPTSSAPWGQRKRLAEIMWEVRERETSPAAVKRREVPETADADEVARVQWLLAKVERERDGAVRRAEHAETLLAGQQLTMATVEAERMLADVCDAVEEHRRSVTGPSAAESWAWADETLWRRKDEILAGSVRAAA